MQHHLDPVSALLNYDPSQLAPALQPTVHNDPATQQAIPATLDPLLARPKHLSPPEFNDLMAFLAALTSPSLGLLPAVIPDQVPSGLPVDRLPR